MATLHTLQVFDNETLDKTYYMRQDSDKSWQYITERSYHAILAMCLREDKIHVTAGDRIVETFIDVIL